MHDDEIKPFIGKARPPDARRRPGSRGDVTRPRRSRARPRTLRGRLGSDQKGRRAGDRDAARRRLDHRDLRRERRSGRGRVSLERTPTGDDRARDSSSPAASTRRAARRSRCCGDDRRVGDVAVVDFDVGRAGVEGSAREADRAVDVAHQVRVVQFGRAQRERERIGREAGRSSGASAAPTSACWSAVARRGLFSVGRARQRLCRDNGLEGRLIDEGAARRNAGASRRPRPRSPPLPRGPAASLGEPSVIRATIAHSAAAEGADQRRSAAAAGRGLRRGERVEVGFELHGGPFRRGNLGKPTAGVKRMPGSPDRRWWTPFKDCFKDQR